jgi:hypothetical protein
MTGSSGPVPAQPQEVDLLAVQRDDRSLDALGAREGADDPHGVLDLLRALTLDVDADLADVLGQPLPRPRPDQVLRRIPSARRRTGTRLAAGALVVSGLLSMSGVAAAVTGDPFSPYRRIVSAVRGPNPDVAKQAADTAVMDQRIVSVRRSINRGDLGAAQAAIDALRTRISDLPESKRPDARKRLDALQKLLGRATARKKAATAGTGSAVTPPRSTKAPVAGSKSSSGSVSRNQSSKARKHRGSGASGGGQPSTGDGKSKAESSVSGSDGSDGSDGKDTNASSSGDGSDTHKASKD